MRLATAEVAHYGPLVECRPTFGDGLTVLSGPNEAGKTLYLEALLRLFEPGISDALTPTARVSDPPRGRVVVEHGGETIECTGDASLCANSTLEPRHLQSIFVVQDTDLALPGSQEYYASIVETLGDIHTTELGRIASALKDRGRLTRKTLNISDDRSNHKAKTVRDDADTLADEIQDYVTSMEVEEIDELAGTRLRVRRELNEAEEDLATQRDAKTVADYRHLSAQLETYREATEVLGANEVIDRDRLDELRELDTQLEHAREDLMDIREEIEATEAEIDECESRLADLSQEIADLDRRESAADSAEDHLEAYREKATDSEQLDRRLRLTKLATVGSVVGAGVAGGAVGLGGGVAAFAVAAILLGIAVLSGGVYWRTNSRLASIETVRDETIHQARDAGFSVETIDEVSSALEDFRGTLQRARNREIKTEQQLETATGELESLETEEVELEDEIEEKEDHRNSLLNQANVSSIEDYAAEVDRLEDLEAEQQRSRQSLVDRFGEPAPDDPMEAATDWERNLESLIDDLDIAQIDPDQYEQDTLAEVQSTVESLQEELAALERELEAHDETLDDFDDRAKELRTEPFIGRSLSLPARTKDGLEALAADVREVVGVIEADARTSRKALELFDRIESDEEQKMTELFDPDGPASRTFDRLTDGRYREVAYDPEANDLTVERSDGQTFGPELLSQGTTDQLYFASRVSLARQLLGDEAGFLLLDDPFMAADPDRLHRGFQTLQDLAGDGWQILYLTAKREVAESMVSEFGLEHHRFESTARRS